MSLNNIGRILPISRRCLFPTRVYYNCNALSVRELSLFKPLCCQQSQGDKNEVNVKDASKDRSTEIPVETSIRYLQSAAYAETYGDNPVWHYYRRNHKGAIPPRKTRKTCIRKGQISTGNPCPICRDEYLVPHPQNIELLKQFISPHTGKVLNYSTTGVCQKKHNELLVAIEVARDEGRLVYDVPFRVYDYSLYRPKS